MERNSKSEFIINVIYVLFISLIVFGVYYVTVKFLLPFVIGAIIAYAVQKPAKKLSKIMKLSQGAWSVILSLVLFIFVGFVLCFAAYKIIVLSFDFVDYLPRLFEKTKTAFGSLEDKYSDIFMRFPDEIKTSINVFFNDTFKNILSSLSNGVTGIISSLIKRLPLVFISGIVTLVASCYISKDFTGLKKFVKSLLSVGLIKKSIKIKDILVGSVFKILKSYLFLSLITALELYIGFLILNVKKPLLFALIIALVDILPVLGSGTVLVPWALTAILLNDYKLGIGISVLYIIMTILRNFLEPKILGVQLGVNSLFTLIAMFIGLKILGFWGLILFPIILIVIIRYYKDEMKEELSD